MIWALAQQGWKAGQWKIGYQSCDDSTAQTGGWDTAKCATNARLYASNTVGDRRRRDVQLRLRKDHRADPQPCPRPGDGQPGEHEPGLTKKWDPGEPKKYYPTGIRNYARVVATDDIQGPADALWSKSSASRRSTS